MKNNIAETLFVLCLFLGIINPLFAQEEKNIANSPLRYAGGMLLGFDFHLPVSIAPLTAGFTTTFSYNSNGLVTTEPLGLFRWYFTGKEHKGWFAQADIGLSISREEGTVSDATFMGGIRGGYRLPLGNSNYVEPYARFGYPFLFGIGVATGVRFSSGKEGKIANTLVTDSAKNKNDKGVKDNGIAKIIGDDKNIKDDWIAKSIDEDKNIKDDGVAIIIDNDKNTNEIPVEIKKLAFSGNSGV